jgi:hypothetical protein
MIANAKTMLKSNNPYSVTVPVVIAFATAISPIEANKNTPVNSASARFHRAMFSTSRPP